MKRDCSIDAYRVCLMFGICLLHSITQAGHNTAWAANMLSWCVPGFMFISGWFGIKFLISKVLKLYLISFYCAAMFVTLDMLFTLPSGGKCLMRAYDIAKGQWFLNAYAIVMCLAPIVNLAIERMTLKELCPLVLLSFGWSFATTLPIGRWIPLSQGLTAYSFLTLLGVYVVARFARRAYDVKGRFYELVQNKRMVLPIVGVSLLMAAIGLGDYNSPFAVVIAGGLFFMFKRCNISGLVGRFCACLGPSMFSVYLMHSHGQGWKYLRLIQDSLIDKGMPIGIGYLVTALMVFCVCVVADLPRRLIAIHFKKPR